MLYRSDARRSDMKHPLRIICVVALVVGCRAKAESGDLLRPAETIPLKGVEGRIDHMAMDPGNSRLYVAALGNNTIEVIDTKASKQVGRITGPKKPQGVASLPVLNRQVIASGEDGAVRVYDHDLKMLGAVEQLHDADNVRFDHAAKLVYVGYGDGALAVIDPQ